MDIAQEEVLTCLGIYLCERLHRIKQKLRAEEQTWQILFCIGVDALRKNFEVCVVLFTCLINDHCHCEQGAVVDSAAEFSDTQGCPSGSVCVCVQGISNLELMCVFVCVFSWR